MKGIETSFLDYSKLPFMSQDIEFPAPIEVEKVRNDVKGADALWIVTPEYNGSVPGALKNFLDWISRPVEVFQTGVFNLSDEQKVKLDKEIKVFIEKL